MASDLSLFITDYLWLPAWPVLSGLIWVLLILVILYLARIPARKLVSVCFNGLGRMLRLLWVFVCGVNSRVRQRNRDVLLARGRARYERVLEKDFVRIADQVALDLGAWPSLHREMREQITRMDDEFVKSAEVPPEPPEWLKVVDAVAQIPAQGSTVIATILADIHVTLKKAMEKSVAEYRQVNRNRYALLNSIVLQWRGLSANLDDLDKKIARLEERTRVIDTHMQTYKDILQGTDQALAMLTKSSASGLLVSVLLLLIAVAGGIINFQLLALPLAEVVGVHGDLLGVRSSDVTAAVVIFLQIIIGLFLLEAAGVTHLLPDIAMLERRKRRGVMYLMLLVLLIMAGMESLLIYTRDTLAADNVMLDQLLAAPVESSVLSMSWIPAIGQVILGFILPLVLIFSVIAFEVFIHAMRTVAGMFLSWLIDVLEMLLRLLSTLTRLAGKLLLALYDVIIFLPLSIERLLKNRQPAAVNENGDAPETDA